MSDKLVLAVREAVRLLREAGARGVDGYPPSEDRKREHEDAAKAVEQALLDLQRRA